MCIDSWLKIGALVVAAAGIFVAYMNPIWTRQHDSKKAIESARLFAASLTESLRDVVAQLSFVRSELIDDGIQKKQAELITTIKRVHMRLNMIPDGPTPGDIERLRPLDRHVAAQIASGYAAISFLKVQAHELNAGPSREYLDENYSLTHRLDIWRRIQFDASRHLEAAFQYCSSLPEAQALEEPLWPR